MQFILAAWLCVAAAGCGSDLVPAGGTAQRDGQPLSGGTVLFMPVNSGKPAFGPIQPDGTFQLTTRALNDGAMAGQYRVSVTGERNPQTERTEWTFIGPPELALEIAPGKENKFQINIRESEGWQRGIE